MAVGTAGRGGRDLRQSLIEAASRLLQEPRTAPAPSLRAVARACDVSATAVYLHFDSRAALIDAVLEMHFAEARERAEAAVAAAAGPRERLDAFALAYVGWALERPGPYQLLFESVDWLKGTGAVRAWMEERTASLADDLHAVDPGIGPEEALERGEQLWTALHGIVAGRSRRGDHVWPREVAEEVVGMVAIFAGAQRLGTPPPSTRTPKRPPRTPR
ncbi:TetR/AcrR family transcriptional regulator [Streptomyces xiaopingdaonensis]|uniref:TetR/AcrR family transcriptional regulator n=1 Tax=Streptomyces xiaopingdaonensis TaxID=1565415 RepID=UPI000318DD85|nr:TetR/AcrR family transcriptional regulator [Streptomyces xiaopingdaonensis]